MAQESSERILVMIRSVLAAEGECLGCEECFELLDHCAELVEGGEALTAVYPEVERHLKDCLCCGAEFDALLAALRAAAQPAEA
jgi:hypothetical protein